MKKIISCVLVAITLTPHFSQAAQERLAVSAGAGAAGGKPQRTVSIGIDAHVEKLTIHSGDRINRITLHGTDGSIASFGGSKNASAKTIALNSGEYVVGFKGVYSNGGGPFRAGWFNVYVIIGGPNGERLSERFGTGGYNSGISINGAAYQYTKAFALRAPAGYEVVGLAGNAGDVIDAAALIVQKR